MRAAAQPGPDHAVAIDVDAARREAGRRAGARWIEGLKVISAKGDYFQVQAVFEGKAIRGYVHREDAFFERPKKDRRPPNGSSVVSAVN